MPDEIELKLRINSRHAARLRRHPLILAVSKGNPLTRKLTSIYFDTPQLYLRQSNINLRVRRMSGSWFQAIKGGGSVVSGLHQRMEWEDIIVGNRPDFTKIVDPGLQKLFADQAMRDALQPIFTTEVRRTEWQLFFDNGDQVELALDLGQLIVGDQTEPISEVELEIKTGKAGRLFELALQLQQDIPLELENVSKSQRGYQHYQASTPSLVKSGLPKIDRDMPAHNAFRRIAWECVHHLQGNQAIVLQDNDVEGLHQMRVALRRLRSAMAAFRPVVAKKSVIAICNELNWLAGIFGTARDLDVLITQTLPPIMAQLQQHTGLRRLYDRALSEREQAYQAIHAAIKSQRYQRLILTLGAWLESENWLNLSPACQQKVQRLASAMLTKLDKRLRRNGPLSVDMTAEELHNIRIAAKKLRYTAEFFASIYVSNKSRRFIRKLEKVQDLLGQLNDITTAEHLIHSWVGARSSTEVKRACHILKGWNACLTMHNLTDAQAVWKKFSRSRPFWQNPV